MAEFVVQAPVNTHTYYPSSHPMASYTDAFDNVFTSNAHDTL